MTFDFDTPVSRLGTSSVKWDAPGQADVLPMWVADMDFRTAPCIIEALQRRVAHGIFGYVRVPDSYYESVTTWFARHHGWTMQPEWIIYTSGVVPALSAILRALTTEGDEVLCLTPSYNCFYSSIRNQGCNLSACRLVEDADGWHIDFDELERLAASPRCRVMLLCNPHNPVGRVWTPEELRRVGDICLRHGVFVVADEIHCELTMPGYHYTPYASLGEDYARHSATCVSPSKAFNIAGLQIANIVVPAAGVRARIDRAINIHEVCDVNPFGVIATEAAYSAEGRAWLDALRAYLAENDAEVRRFFARHLPAYRLSRLEGTYLEWIDCRHTGLTDEALSARLISEARVRLNEGTMYGPGGEGFLRLNIATPRSLLQEGLERMQRVMEGL